MQQLTILQVGDVHFPDHNRRDADLKDDALADPLVATATASELQAATRALLAAIGNNPNALLAFTGDLTSRGDLAEYMICVSFLDRAFLLSDPKRWTQAQLHAVPGNHDVNRALAATAPPGDLFHKFVPLTDAWATCGLDILAAHSVRITTLDLGSCVLHAYGLNSCLGCGERRELPQSLRADLTDKLAASGVEAHQVAKIVEDVLSAHAEVIDAPAYAEAHVEEIYQSVRQAGDAAVAVLVAHHNLLQQAQPRLDLYTDLLNAGMLRSRLSSLDVPVLYLHGHIHSDPIETISQAAPDQGQVICISAPEFRDGFNQIDVAFSDDGTPIGCIVKRFRVRLHGGTSIESPVRIRFNSYESAISSLASETAIALLSHPNASSLLELRKRLPPSTRDISDQDLANAIEEVEWLGLVEVLNRERPLRNWRLRGVTHSE